jgi:chromosomal replication initiator protein
VERIEMSHEGLWNEAVAFTRAKSPASFEQWFSGVQYDGMTDGIVSLRARDEFVREWVDQHFLPTLVDYLRSQTGWSVQIAWSIGGDLERPVSGPVGPTLGDDAPSGLRARPSGIAPQMIS